MIKKERRALDWNIERVEKSCRGTRCIAHAREWRTLAPRIREENVLRVLLTNRCSKV